VRLLIEFSSLRGKYRMKTFSVASIGQRFAFTCAKT